jgi:nicotinate-nucleotide pyrophosphorylase (carboxylating)
MFELKRLIETALDEDVGREDITTSAIALISSRAKAELIAKEELILAGIDIAKEVFIIINPDIKIKGFFSDGQEVDRGKVIAGISGNTADLLRGERVALNFLRHLSGIATLTRKYVNKVKGYPALIIDTRKTTPGLRTLEKYAVRVGGGRNHRFGLFDGVLIKENHIKVCGSISEAIKRVKSAVPHTLKIEIEARNIEDVKEALAAGVDAIMLDNMPKEKMEESVRIIAHQTLVEASGNISLDTAEEVARTGVDLISVGGITHSAPASDISMKIKELEQEGAPIRSIPE